MRRDSYLGLKGLTFCHGVYFPGTPFSRSFSKVLGNVSGRSQQCEIDSEEQTTNQR